MVTIKRQPESNLRLPISRRQLLTTISYDDLNADRLIERWLVVRNSIITVFHIPIRKLRFVGHFA